VHKIISLIRLIRLHNCIMAGIGVWLGAYLTNGGTGEFEIYFASLAAALVCGGGNALNDYLDIESDRINHPRRPLASGDLPPFMAIIMALAMDIAAIISAAAVNLIVLIIVALSIILLAVYNFSFKKTALLGNLIISVLGGMTFIVGGLTVDLHAVFILPGPLVPAVFAFLFHLGRELLKDIADFEGDIKTNCRTLVSVLSGNSVMAMVSTIYTVLIFLTLIPIFQNWFRPAYANIAILAVDIPIIIILIYFWISKSPTRFAVAGTALKLLMLFGLLAFYFGKI